MKARLKRIAEQTLAPIAPFIWRMRPAPRLLVLMYHRVLPATHAERAIEQPGMYVSPETLDLHLTTLRRHFELVDLEVWLRDSVAGKTMPAQSCALTFDDGWRDNFEYAFPVLRHHRAPATIFLVSNMTGTNKVFWPNRLARLLTRLPAGASLAGPLGEVLAPLVAQKWGRDAWSVEDLDRAIGLAKRLAESEVEAALGEAEAQAGVPEDGRVVLNHEEVEEMARSGLVRFGSHTRTHFRLRGAIAPSVLEQEIGGSGEEIRASIGSPASLFCYPNGDLTDDAVNVVRRHYIGAVTTRKGWYTVGTDPFRIPRIGVHEDISSRPAAFLARISGLA